MACRRGQPGLECRCFSRRAGSGGGSGRGGRSRRSPADVAAEPSRSGGGAPLAGSADDRGEVRQKPAIPTCDDNLSLASRRVRKFFGDNRRQPSSRPGLPGRARRRSCNCLGISAAIGCTKRFCIRGLTRSSGHIERNLHDCSSASVFVGAADLSGQRTDITDIIEEAGRSGSRRREEVGVAGKLRLLNFDLGTGRSHRVKKRLLAYSVEPPKLLRSGLERAGLLRPPVLRLEPVLTACNLSHSAWCNCSMLYNPIRGALRALRQGQGDAQVPAASGLLCRNHSEGFLFSNLAAQRQHAKPTSVNCKSVKAGRRLGSLL
uniref:Uncharacterized protein n=1 Tax=Macrostomum lignano TaxID=282301 RepID=A0A1I8FMP9_9PLAT